MNKLTIKTATEEDFFRHGRKLAKLADRGARLPAERIISFEDHTEVLKLLTAARLRLFRAVKRDVDELEKVGPVCVESKVLPGHGRMKEVRVAADRFRLEALLA